MLRLDLARLAREGSVLVEASIPAGDPLWEDSELPLGGPVRVRLRASHAGTGELVVRGELSAPLRQECRRCLEPVESDLDEEVTMVFVASEGPGSEDDGDARSFDAGAGELDLSGAVREELILAADPYALCAPGCKGLCGGCGVNLNEEACQCEEEGSDPRWDALKALRER